MNWKEAERTLQSVGLFLLAMDNAEGYRKGLAQPNIKPSPVTERVFALLKEIRQESKVPPERPVTNLRRVVASGSFSGVGHALTFSGKLACGRKLRRHLATTKADLGPGDCKKCLAVLRKLRIQQDRFTGGFLISKGCASDEELLAVKVEWKRMRDKLSTLRYAEVTIGGVSFEWHGLA